MKRPWRDASQTAALTSLLFIVLYAACNHLTHARTDKQVWVFAGEEHWPFVPAMIVPYWSIDLLFVLAPFCCASAAEVLRLRRRLLFAIVGAAIGFLLIPLRLAYPRPEATGAFAFWFAAIRGFDLPYNLFPSLHIALCVVLAEFYARKAGARMRWLVVGWFGLIAISTLLTWQHHVIDVIGGAWLGGIARHLFADEVSSAAARSNLRVALGYGVAAIACTQLARINWPWGVLLTWPAFAFGAAACVYAGRGNLYRKAGGCLTVSTKAFFGPLLLGQWLSWCWYRSRSAAFDVLSPNVWIGRQLTEVEAKAVVAAGVTAVLDLTAEFSAPRAFRAVHYRNLAVLDLTAPSPEQLAEAAEFIQRESRHGVVYVHCKAGYSRTAGAATAWMLAAGQVENAPAAFRALRNVRPRIVIRPEVQAAFGAGANLTA